MSNRRLLSRRVVIAGAASIVALERALPAPKQLCGFVADAPSGGGGGGGPAPGTSVCPSTTAATILGGNAQVNGAGIGAADSSRLVVVTVSGWRGLPVSPLVTATLNGVTARFLDLSQVNDAYCSIVWGMVPAGTTVNVVLNYQSSIAAMVMTICNVRWPTFPNPYVRDAGKATGASSGAVLSLGLLMPANGFVYGAYTGVDGTNGASTWTGAVKNYDAANGSQWLSTAAGVGGSVGSNLTVTATNPNTNKSLEAITVVNATTVTTPIIVQHAINQISSGQLNATFPVAPTPGNLIVALCNPYATSGPNVGWVQLNDTGDTGQAHQIFYRIAQVGDVAYQNPAPGYPGINSVTAIYEIANYDDGNGSATAWGKGLSAFASWDGITNKPAVVSYSDTISSTFPQMLILGLVQTPGTTVAGVSGAVIDDVTPGNSCASFHQALGVGSVTLVGSGAVSSQIVWQTCVIAPRYR